MASGYKRSISGRTFIMGILNVTPDSFSDGGMFLDKDKAVARALEMRDEGADIIDVGGESTRPGFIPVECEEEKRRIIPVIRQLSDMGMVISVDTTKPEVAIAASENGASIINDIGGDLRSSGMAEVAAMNGSGLVIMFNCRRNGTQDGSILNRAISETEENIEYALAAGVDEDRIIIDPGIGFGTTRSQDIELTRGLKDLSFGDRFPVLYAASRKRVVKDIIGGTEDMDLLDDSSDALALAAVSRGASLIRSHRIRNLRDQLNVFDRIMEDK